MIELIPLFDKDGKAILWDIYVDGKWLGSRSKKEHAQAYAEWWSK